MNGYYLTNDEQIVTYDELINQNKYLLQSYEAIFNYDFDTIKTFINFICQEKYITIPYKNIFNNQIK